MNIAIVCIHYPVASGRYAARAFRRLGHDVRTLGYSSGNRIWGGKVASKYEWHPDGNLTKHWPDWTPDLMIIMESAWAYHHPTYTDVPHIVWGVDNHVRDYRQDGVEHYFLAHNAVSVMGMSAEDVTPLPCGYDPEYHTPSPIPYHEREFDVALIGVLYPQRREVLEVLATAGLKVRGATGLLFEEYRDAYHNARIALNVSAAGDLSQRIFETAAMGCYVLTDELPDIEKLPGLSVYTFADTEEVVQQAKKLLKAEEPANEWVAEHTWDNRAQVIVNWYRERYVEGEASTDA